MEILIMAVIAFVIAVLVRRKEALDLRWQPTRHTWVAVGAGLAAFALSASLLLFSGPSVGASIVHYVLIYVICGFAVPWAYTLLVERETPAAMGLTRDRWVVSLIVNLVLGGFFALLILLEADLSAISLGEFGRAAFVLLVGTLFESFLYCGFIHLRLETAFGTIPAILGTSVLYVLWHAGTQLPLEADPVAAVWKLLLVGIMYQAVFSITHNLLVVWPFFMGAGVMIDFAVNIGKVAEVSPYLPWAVVTVVLMSICGMALSWVIRRRSIRTG